MKDLISVILILCIAFTIRGCFNKTSASYELGKDCIEIRESFLNGYSGLNKEE